MAIPAILVAFDMLVLRGKIKLWIIAVANTTDYSPFSTDGQSNWVYLLVTIGVIIGIAILVKLLQRDDGGKKDE